MTSLTVTATQSGGSFNGILLSVRVLTGADAAASQAGATASGRANELAITTTQAGSWVAGGISDPSGATWSSPTAATSQLDQVNDSTNGCTYLTIASASATGTPGATTYGYASPVVTDSSVAFTLAEILKASGQNLAQDASTPASASTDSDTTVTTASFSPPSGSLLVAQVASDSNDTSVTIDITDSASLTWHQLVYATGGAFMASGVWVADAPSGGGGATIPGVPATASASAPAGTVTAGASIPGAVSTASSSAPAGSVTAGATIAGPVATAASLAPAGTVTAGATIPGVTATSTATAPAGSVSTAATIPGVLATAAASAPAGSVSAGAVIAGVVAAAASSAPAGSVSAGATVAGVVSSSAALAPAGAVLTGVVVPGATATALAIALAGSVSAGVTVTGVTATALCAALAGTVSAGVTIAGPVASSAAQAPAGRVSTSGASASLLLALGIL